MHIVLSVNQRKYKEIHKFLEWLFHLTFYMENLSTYVVKTTLANRDVQKTAEVHVILTKKGNLSDLLPH